MNDLAQDPIINVIHNGIKKGIRITLDNQCYGSAIILILSGIDTMAYLSMPPTQQEVSRNDFVKWCNRYIRFPGMPQLSGLELYGSRCGMLHCFSTGSKLCKKGECRQIIYMDNGIPPIRFNPEISKDLVVVSIKALADAFFMGVDKFFIDIYSSEDKKKVADERFKYIIHNIPFENPSTVKFVNTTRRSSL
jgi:hypothetical protein